MMKIREVASLKEALSIKVEMNHKGDYKIQAWESGRELIIQLSDYAVHYRWKEGAINQVLSMVTDVTSQLAEKENLMPKPNTSLVNMQGSNVFAGGRKRGRLK